MPRKKPGNELAVSKFILENLGQLDLKHLGVIKELGNPIKESPGFRIINTESDLATIKSDSSSKKADIYLNGSGVSVKQAGGSNPYNRLQRANIIDVYNELEFTEPEKKLVLLDSAVNEFHQGNLTSRNVPWSDYLPEQDFKNLLEFLMMKASPNLGVSPNPAKYILEAPKQNISQSNICLYTFDEYFDLYKDKISIAIRRVWYGQSSNSEHGRAKSLISKPGNSLWVFNNVSGQPGISKKTGKRWRDDVSKHKRKTVYFLNIEKK